MKAIHFILYCALFFLLSCNNDNTTSNNISPNNSSTKQNEKGESNIKAAPIDYKTLSEAYCKCAENTVNVSSKLKKLMDDNEIEAFDALLPAADKAFKEAMECCRDAKFQQTMGAVDQKKLLKPLKANCPELPKQLVMKMMTEIK